MRSGGLLSWLRSREPSAPPEAVSKFSIGKYPVIERIGSGGFGTVFKAWDPIIKRPVAIKTCNVTGDLQTRFVGEAEIAGRLQHPNITTVYECGTDGETPFIVQEFLSGEDLSQIIARRDPIDVSEKVRILVGVAIGLEFAHNAGVIHRDIKPANVRVLENRAVKIMDFGIAKAIGSASTVTKSGVAVGSSPYMSPEQICGDSVDTRSDIFSFGVLAYELLSYAKPFQAESLFRLLERIVKEEPVSLSKIASDVPQSLVAVVERAMRKKASDRFASMRELREALLAPLTESAAEPKPSLDSEAERLETLHGYGILDTGAEAEFDDLARLAAQVCDTPIAWISFVDHQRQWFKSRIGTTLPEVPRETSFCATTIRGTRVLVVSDTAKDERFATSPLVRSEPHIRFYAGAPLITPGGVVLGTLSVLDRGPRILSDAQTDALRILAQQVVAQLELKRRQQRDSGEKLLRELAGLSASPDQAPVPVEPNA